MTAMTLADDEQRVLEVFGKSERGLTVNGAYHQVVTWHAHVWLSRYGRNWRESEVRGIITRLVRKGYLKRDGTEVLRWYTVTTFGRGYLSVPDPDAPVTADGEPVRTKTGRVVTEGEIGGYVAEAEQGYDIEDLRGRERS
jgi:hypothetical protein